MISKIPSNPVKAFLFDMNGTMIDDMGFHQKAWYRMVHDELGSPISFEDVKTQMYGKNEELLWRVFPGRDFSKEELDEISARKEGYYKEEYRPHLKFIDGLDNFLIAAERKSLKMAIASAAVPGNISFILDNLGSRHYFSAIVSADDVVKSKPDPETFLKAAKLLGVEPANCIVFEDAPKGVECALNAGMECVALTTMHSADEFSKYPNILFCIKDYTDPILQKLLS